MTIDPLLDSRRHGASPTGVVAATPLFPVEKQLTDFWCWAAVTAAMVDPLGVRGLHQWDVVACVLPHLGQPPCSKPIPTDFWVRHGLDDALGQMGARQRSTVCLPATAPWSAVFHTIAVDLWHGHPPSAQVLVGTTRDPHAVLIGGYGLHATKGEVLLIADPAGDGVPKEMFAAEAGSYAGTADWTHLFRTM